MFSEGGQNGAVEGMLIPALLSSSEEYKPMLLKKRFEEMAAALARQAYWLSWLESIEAMGPGLSAASFKTPNRRKGESIQTPVWAEGFIPTAAHLARFEAARKRARTKLYGKNMPSEDDVVSEALGGWAYHHDLSEASRDQVMAAAMGPQLYAYCRSKAEREQLSAQVQEPQGEADDARRGSRRL